MDSILDELHAFFQQHAVDYTLFKDKLPFATTDSGATQYGIALSEAAPTFIIKTENYAIAAIIRGDTRISFNKLKGILSLTKIRFAKPDEVFALTGAKVGYVSLINRKLETWIDKKLLEKAYVYGGCGIPNYTLKIKVEDLVKLTKAHVADFTDIKQVAIKPS